MSYVSRATHVPWEALQVQFGSGYPLTARGKRDFKGKFLGQLKKVSLIYPEAKFEVSEKTICLLPSKTHVPKLKGHYKK